MKKQINDFWECYLAISNRKTIIRLRELSNYDYKSISKFLVLPHPSKSFEMKN